MVCVCVCVRLSLLWSSWRLSSGSLPPSCPAELCHSCWSAESSADPGPAHTPAPSPARSHTHTHTHAHTHARTPAHTHTHTHTNKHTTDRGIYALIYDPINQIINTLCFQLWWMLSRYTVRPISHLLCRYDQSPVVLCWWRGPAAFWTPDPADIACSHGYVADTAPSALTHKASHHRKKELLGVFLCIFRACLSMFVHGWRVFVYTWECSEHVCIFVEHVCVSLEHVWVCLERVEHV